MDDSRQITSATGRAPTRPWAWIGAAAVLALTTAAFAWVAYRHTQEEPPRAVTLNLRIADQEFSPGRSISLPVVSPDGRSTAFLANGALWLRDLRSPQVRRLADWVSGRGPNPFLSPDSRSIGFHTGRKLMKIAAAGGPAQVICEIARIDGATWNRADVIVISNSEGTWRVPAAGGTTTRVLELDKSRNEDRHYSPSFLPDGHHFLYSANSGERAKSAVYVGDLNSKDRKLVLAVPSNTVYVEPGYLLFVENRALLAQPFDSTKLQTTGDAVPLADDVFYSVNWAKELSPLRRTAFCCTFRATVASKANLRGSTGRGKCSERSANRAIWRIFRFRRTAPRSYPCGPTGRQGILNFGSTI